ncbi:hypothetical protein HaLaN_19594, partial [Haematococcus lacustris]
MLCDGLPRRGAWRAAVHILRRASQ